MTMLRRFDPPAFLQDFAAIPGQMDAWHAAVSTWFDAVVDYEAKAIGEASQYYNAAKFDPGGLVVEQAVTWNAFPKELIRAFGREKALAIADGLWPIERYGTAGLLAEPWNDAGLSGVVYRPQEEYCEWWVERDPHTGKIQRITFTSEPPEYWQALSGFVPGSDPIPDMRFPSTVDALLTLYRTLVSPEVQPEDLIVREDIKDADGNVVTKKGQYHIYNKWNTTHGIAHLNSPPNSLVAEIQLGGDATVLRTDPFGKPLVEPDALICYARYGGPNRNSDPTIGAAVNALARLGAYVTLRNPVGLYMDHIDLSGWSAPDGKDIAEFVRTVRGSPGMVERMVIEVPSNRGICVGDLTIGGVPIRYGGQVAECITVKLVGLANVVPSPLKKPPMGVSSRGYVDPFFAHHVRLTRTPAAPLPPGTAEVFRYGDIAVTTLAERAMLSDRAAALAVEDPRPERDSYRRKFRTR
jgi:hypothetical protein